LERDIPQLGPRIPAETLRRFWTMLAHEQGQIINHARIAAGLAVSGQTVARYLDLLTDLLLVRQLRPWSRNVGKRLVRSPKVYIRDSGIAHALLGLRTRDDVLAHPVAGPSWEGYAIENLCAAAPPGAEAWFFRTAAGAEIDLVLELAGARVFAIEIKRSLAPGRSKGFALASADVGATHQYVVYPGVETFALDRHTSAIPLAALVAAIQATARR
jgi:predicted AAA+ superfamily ATPase